MSQKVDLFLELINNVILAKVNKLNHIVNGFSKVAWKEYEGNGLCRYGPQMEGVK